MNWKMLSERILGGALITRAEALSVLESSDDDLLEVLQAAFVLRRHYFGRDVRLHVLRNAQSGLCSEDCAYCSQSAKSTADVSRYAIQTVEEIVEGARAARALQALRYCVVISGRMPREQELEMVCRAARRIKSEVPIQLCVSLGLINAEQARRLKQAGVDRFNHNLETSARFYPSICTTHRYEDRVATARIVKQAGLELCSGGIIGMGETLADRVELAFALREVGADSIPVNFLDPRQGTALAAHRRPGATEALRALVMFRLVNPERELRIAGGREACLGALQPLALYPANSLFTNGYLTTGGQGYQADLAMIEAAGFKITDITQA